MTLCIPGQPIQLLPAPCAAADVPQSEPAALPGTPAAVGGHGARGQPGMELLVGAAWCVCYQPAHPHGREDRRGACGSRGLCHVSGRGHRDVSWHVGWRCVWVCIVANKVACLVVDVLWWPSGIEVRTWLAGMGYLGVGQLWRTRCARVTHSTQHAPFWGCCTQCRRGCGAGHRLHHPHGHVHQKTNCLRRPPNGVAVACAA